VSWYITFFISYYSSLYFSLLCYMFIILNSWIYTYSLSYLHIVYNNTRTFKWYYDCITSIHILWDWYTYYIKSYVYFSRVGPISQAQQTKNHVSLSRPPMLALLRSLLVLLSLLAPVGVQSLCISTGIAAEHLGVDGCWVKRMVGIYHDLTIWNG